MQIILMRHGEAANAASTAFSSDEARLLTVKGQQQAQATAEQIIKTYQPDLFVVSPLIRAQQTQQQFNELLIQSSTNSPIKSCADIPVVIYEGIKPEDDARDALEWLSKQDAECMVVVCHMNIVAYLAGLLTNQSPQSFGLAEARVYEQVAIGLGFSTEVARFTPQI